MQFDQKVVGIDNLITGKYENLKSVKLEVTYNQWKRFKFINADITDKKICNNIFKNIDHVLHQAALGSVPRSIIDPITSNYINVNGFLNMIYYANKNKVRSFTYASSSSVYGDHKLLPKKEKYIGKQLSTYALTKYINELYSEIFCKNYNFNSIGLRYFNVFGKRQNPDSQYSAVIPKWIKSIKTKKNIEIFGNGKNTRDFCHIENVIQANLLAAFAKNKAQNKIFNIATGSNISLNQLYILLRLYSKKKITFLSKKKYLKARKGDVKHSLADISNSKKYLGYEPTVSFNDGLRSAIDWYFTNNV